MTEHEFSELIYQEPELRAACEGDYYDTEGLLMCGKCNTRRELDIMLPLFSLEREVRVGIRCACRSEAAKLKEEELERQQKLLLMKELRKQGVADAKFANCTFDKDDGRNAKQTAVCRNYVDKFDELRKDNIGMILHGGVGTGKSFLAGCIANAMIEKLIPVYVTTFPRLINKINEDFNYRQQEIDELDRYSLLVIDDLGVERGTEYVMETVFAIIDNRLRVGKPTIITTNLTKQQLANPLTTQQGRVYDRINEMCPIALVLEGKSGRQQKAQELKEKAREILLERGAV